MPMEQILKKLNIILKKNLSNFETTLRNGVKKLGIVEIEN
jgi:hypothetical protein